MNCYSKEFGERDLDLDFDYRVFNGSLATRLDLIDIQFGRLDKYSMPLFDDKEELVNIH